jgi:hypothetical protein
MAAIKLRLWLGFPIDGHKAFEKKIFVQVQGVKNAPFEINPG